MCEVIRLCDHWTPEQKRKAEEALQEHLTHIEAPTHGFFTVISSFTPVGGETITQERHDVWLPLENPLEPNPFYQEKGPAS